MTHSQNMLTKPTSTAPNPQYKEQYKNVPNQNENITVAQGSNSTNTNQLPTFDLSNMDLLEFDDQQDQILVQFLNENKKLLQIQQPEPKATEMVLQPAPNFQNVQNVQNNLISKQQTFLLFLICTFHTPV